MAKYKKRQSSTSRYKTKRRSSSAKSSASKTTSTATTDSIIREEDVLKALGNFYHSDLYSSQPFVFITHVRNLAGYKGNRTIDALSIGVWPSKGHHVSAHEVKCSRSDWLSELKNPEKSKPFTDHVDFFYVVQSQLGIVKPSELPERWGLMTMTLSKKIYIQQQATQLQDPQPIPRGLWIAMLKRAILESN